MRFSHYQGRVMGTLLTLGLGCVSLNATAQTWAGNRQGPALTEIVTIDQTGETGWLWGREDVAGDGLNTFDAPEQAIDGRAVYLSTSGNRLWYRLTLSSTAAPEGNLVTYLFVDADRNVRTGRTAAAEEIDPLFTTDPTEGGYEYVLAVRGDGTVDGLWELNDGSSAFVAKTLNADELVAERGLYLDPLRIGQDDRGYLQASVAQSSIGVTSQCASRFFVRATNDNASLGDGDIDIGEAADCIPADANNDAVPDVLEPNVECNTAADCIGNAVCWNHRCWLSAVCIGNADCAPTETCVDGQCRVTGGDGCNNVTDCGALVCDNGQCVACTTNAGCGTGRVCSPDGRCVDEATADQLATNNGGAGGTGGTGGATNNGGNAGSNNTAASAGNGIDLADDERIQGGACSCHVVSPKHAKYSLLLGILGLGWWGRRSGRRGISCQGRTR
jgi:hypothetical protein